MGFNFASFAGGLAKGGSAALDDRAGDKKAAIATKRSLMFNATEALYNNALDVKKANDILKNDDKKYISKIKSIDPTISTDNMNKLLSLNVADRLKAQEEYDYRAAQSDSGVSSFGDFMSYVDDASDLNNPDKITTSIEASMVPAPQTPKAYYDKTGLISDKSVNNLFSEVSGVLADVHGMSIAQAKAITEQGIYSVQHPPIKINWSKDIKVQRGVLEELAKASIYSQNQLQDQAVALINKRVTLTGIATNKLRESFAANYTTDGVDTDGKPTGKRVKVAAAFAPTEPNFESDFRSSPEYLKYATESISPYIMSMETDPDVNTANAMTYINGTFPGLYGGKIDTQTLTEEAFAEIVPTKVYYVNAPPLVGPANPSGADSDGFIMTGATLKGTRVDKNIPNDVTDAKVPKVGTTISNSGLESDIAKQEKRVLDSTKLGETDSTVKREEEFTEKLKQVKVTEDYFTNLDTAPKPADAAKMTDAVRNILDRGDVTEIEAAFNKISGWSSSMGQPFTVSTAITNAISSLGEAIQAKDVGESSSEVTTFLSTSLDGISKSAVEAAIRKINKYPKHIKNRDDVKAFKEKLYLTLAGM